MGVEIAISIAREETRVAVLDNGVVVTDLYGDRPRIRITSAIFIRDGWRKCCRGCRRPSSISGWRRRRLCMSPICPSM